MLGTKDTSGEWKAELLSRNHNGTDQGEVERLKSEHPGEGEVILNDRVLGAIAVTRGNLVEERHTILERWLTYDI